jgi:hypothetical protein
MYFDYPGKEIGPAVVACAKQAAVELDASEGGLR